MKLDRALLVSGFLLVLQIAFFAWMQRTGESEQLSRPLVPGLAQAAVDRVVLGGASDDDHPLTIMKKDDVWVLADHEDHPADTRSIEALLRTLLVLHAQGPIITQSQSHQALGIADGEAEGRLRLFTPASDAPFVDLLFGSSSPSGAAYVRNSGDDEVFEVLGLTSWDVRPDVAPWLEQPFVEIDIQYVDAIRVERPEGSFTVRSTAKGWVVDDGKQTRDADPTLVANTLQILGSLAPVVPAGVTNGDLPEISSRIVSVRCELRGGNATLIQFGSGSSSARIAVASPERSHAVEVWKNAVDPILELTAEKASGV